MLCGLALEVWVSFDSLPWSGRLNELDKPFAECLQVTRVHGVALCGNTGELTVDFGPSKTAEKAPENCNKFEYNISIQYVHPNTV